MKNNIEIYKKGDGFMLNIGLFAAASVIVFPAVIVLAYIYIINNRYVDVCRVYEVEDSSIAIFIGCLSAAYIFLCGYFRADIPFIIGNVTFLICMGLSLFLSIVIIQVLAFFYRDKIKYANILLADKKICSKVQVLSEQIGELLKTMNYTAKTPSQKKENDLQIKEMRSMVTKLIVLHQELQAQKVLMTTKLGTNEIKKGRVDYRDGKNIAKELDTELDKINAFQMIGHDYRDIKDLIKKYQ